MVLRDNIKISIIIPAYNRESYIGGCLESVLRQTIFEKEIICIDDGSDDATLDVMNDYASKYKSIVVLKQEHAGVSAARNYGIREAKGEYIAFMDSDDWYPEDDVLEYMYDKAKEYQVFVVGGGIAEVPDNNTGKSYACGNPYRYFKKEEITKFSDAQLTANFSRFIYLRSFLLDNNIIFPDSIVGEDAYFLFHVLLKAETYLKLNKLAYIYRVSYKEDARITRQHVLDIMKLTVKTIREAKRKRFLKVQEHFFARTEIIPFYRYVSLEKGEFLKILQELWKESLFDELVTRRMLLSENSIVDIKENGKGYEEKFISDILKFDYQIIYGDSGLTKYLIAYLKKFNVNISYICVSKGYLSQNSVNNIPVIEVDDLVSKVDVASAIFLVAARSFSHDIIQKNLERLGCKNFKMVDFKKLQLFPHALNIDFVWS